MSEKSDFSYDVYNMLCKLLMILIKNKTITHEEASTTVDDTSTIELLDKIQKDLKK